MREESHQSIMKFKESLSFHEFLFEEINGNISVLTMLSF